MSKDQILITVVVVLLLLTTIWGVWYQTNYNKAVRDTQRIITDLDLLRLFEKQPGGLLSADMIAERTDLSKSEVNARLSSLHTGGLLRAGMNPTGTKYFYELRTELEEVPGLKLSGSAFLTIEDLQQIFIAYDYKVSPHDLMVTTGLPWKVLSREMQYFRKEGMVEVVLIDRPGDAAKQYVLLEAYHAEKLDLNQAEAINEKVKKVLFDEQLLV